MPPPNITGQLHMGHAMFLTLQDIRTRFHALIGDDALWLPGTDHAGLATHEKILTQMAQDGSDPRDRHAYLACGWEWKDRHHSRIIHQIKRMGASCDWSQERFTLDAGYQNSTREAFRRCWDAGLIYRHEDQWWMKMESLAAPLVAAIESGDIQINPLTSANELLPMLRNIEPWCLSRQIGWGMPIPLKQHDGKWLFDEGDGTPGAPETDTLDTWFLSSLWPMASLGWPDIPEQLERFYPGEWMETGDDILFFWCARMWMMGYFLEGQWPFKKLFLHGLIRDKNGRKMAKSLGNGIDPLELMDQYGTDALRWHLAMRAEPARDMKFSAQACASDGKWINKIWQAGRFLNQFGGPQGNDESSQAREMLSGLTNEWAAHLENDRYPDAARLIQSSFRDQFCGKWIEDNKPALRAGCLDTLELEWAIYFHYLALLHPFLPFLTTDLHRRLWNGDCMDDTSEDGDCDR
jgi:valyl-tRNA synthetase